MKKAVARGFNHADYKEGQCADLTPADGEENRFGYDMLIMRINSKSARDL